MQTPLSGRPSSRLASWLLAASLSLVAGSAWAGDYAYVATHVTKKSPEHVLQVLTAYGKYCDRGCQYYGPDVKEFIQLDYQKTATSWYTWTWVSTSIKDVKYFNHVRLIRKKDGTIIMVTRQLDSQDAVLVEQLKKKTGKEHNPAFDTGQTTFVIQSTKDQQVKVVQDMKMSASGMLDLFGGKIRDGMKAGAAATFKNIEK